VSRVENQLGVESRQVKHSKSFPTPIDLLSRGIEIIETYSLILSVMR
jgi:hypothetical protein